jgi:hypothetical protein
MADRVIQGFFAAGRPVVQPQVAATARHAPPPVPQARPAPGPARVGPPPPAGAPRPAQPQAGQGRPTAPVQRKSGGFAVDPAVLRTAGPGRPLPDEVRAQMESALGADFSAVRVHVGPQAESIGALAFTTGTDIYFAPGRFQPDTAEGRRLLGHELAHVVQQRQGRVRGGAGAVTVVQDAALEAEADRAGVRAASAAHGPVRQQTALSATRPSSPVAEQPVQRLTAIAFAPSYDRKGTDKISTFRHVRVAHNATQTKLAAFLSGYDPQNVPSICNHYVAYSMIENAVHDKIQSLTLDQAVTWLTNLALPGSQTFLSQTDLGIANSNWNVTVGALPKVNIPNVAPNGAAYSAYNEITLNNELDDFIFNLANDPRNLFYWPQSSGDAGGTQVDMPKGAGAMPLTKLKARLAAYHQKLTSLGLNL